VQPSFNRRALEAIVAAAVPCVEALLERWSRATEVELLAEMNRLTVDVAARVLLGVELEEEARRIGAAARTLTESWAHAPRQIFRMPSWIPLARQQRQRKAIRYLRQLIDRIIRQHSPSGPQRSDLLSRLVAAYSEAPGDRSKNHELLIDQVLTLFIAAYHASTVTLCWTFYLLAHHPEIHQQVVAEIDHVLGDRAPSLADLQQLPRIEQVLKESMRLYPSAWEIFPREAVAATQLGEWQIPRGAWLLLSPYVTQRDSRFFAEPLVFDPHRWSPARVEAIDPRAYFPFGGGRHVCVGREMAMAQNTLMLVMILQRTRLQFVQQHVPARLPPLALLPRDPMRVTLQPRPVLSAQTC
jgi:cytochrome P450